jgi:UPF0755 protein
MEDLSSQNNEDVNLNIPSDKSSLPKKSVFYIVFLFLLFLVFYFLFLSAPNNFPKGGTLTIKQGESLNSISKNLKDNKMIRSTQTFEAFVILYGGEKHLLIGDYIFENKVPVFEVARRIAQKERNLVPIKVTIPEGFNNLEIAETFSSKLKNFNKDKFLTEAKSDQGYLFPDTYFFFSSDDDVDVFNYMRNNFDKKIKTIQKDLDSSTRSEKEIIIMASLVEKEAKGDNDRGIISGILWNRIAKKMPLQVDVAPDTYKTRGLPESPICNPGIEAIVASIKPMKSSYLYYLHDKDGVIHYAKTFEEHKKNITKYLK